MTFSQESTAPPLPPRLPGLVGPRLWARLLLFAAAYYACVRLGQVFQVRGYGVVAAWPSSGLFLGVLLVSPFRLWPAASLVVGLVNTLANVGIGNAWAPSIGFSLVDMVEGVVAAGAVTQVLGRRPSLSRLQDVVALVVLPAVVCNPVTALLGAAVAAGSSLAGFWSAWETWALSNGIGMLLVTPIVLGIAEARSGPLAFGPLIRPRTAAQAVELVFVYAAIVAVGLWVFTRGPSVPAVAASYLVLPLLLWSALRFGPFHSSTAALAVALVAGWYTGRGRGPFAVLAGGGAPELLGLQIFLGVASVSSLVAAAVVQERKRTEDSLAAYRLLTENAADAMLFLGAADGRILEANQAAADAYGYTCDELRTLTADALVPPWRRSRIPAPPGERIESPFLWETTHRRRDGSTFPVELHGRVVALGGEPVIVTVHRDLTARKRDEQVRREAEERGAQAQRRFRAVFENVRDAILVLEGERCVEANVYAEHLYGFEPGQLVGRTLLELSPPAQPGGRPSAEAVAERLAVAGRGEYQYFEWTHRRRDGRPFEAEVGLTPVQLDGRDMIIAVVHDITERRALENQLRQAQKMEAVGRLAGGVAHDFNNLLTVIKGYAELAALDLAVEGEQGEALDEIRKAADRASGLTRQLLAFSRKQILEPVLLDLNTVIADMDRMLRRLIGEEVELLTIATEGAWPVFADRGQVEQVVVNLALNARDAMPHGGRLTIEAANTEIDADYARTHPDIQPGSYVVLAVSDTGVGMSAEVKAHIFEPFFTTKERGKGTGLGLSTVYGIVRQSGGQVTFYTELGRGTTFRVYLPAANTDRPVEARATPMGEVRHGQETILVVEDDPAVRSLASRLLERWGYRVIVAPGGAEALAISRAEPEAIDLLLTDVVMPRMGGREVAAQLTSERPGLKVLYMSGYTPNAIVHHGVLDPGVSLIQKPFSPDGLARKVREVLEGRMQPGAS